MEFPCADWISSDHQEVRGTWQDAVGTCTLHRKVFLALITLYCKVNTMSSPQDALENLRVIRSLMEKAHIYRAISAPAALVGGLLAVGLGAYGGFRGLSEGVVMSPITFLVSWHVILLISGVINVYLLSKEATLRGQPLISEGMRTAMRAISPPLIVGGVMGAGLILGLNNLTMAVLVWTVCYGLSLLATSNFAPRSLTRLGWAFVSVGLILFIIWSVTPDIRLLASDDGPASLVMAISFGLLHIVYAIAVFVSKKPEAFTAE